MKIDYKDSIVKLEDLKRNIDSSTQVDEETKVNAKNHIDAVIKIIENPITSEEANEMKYEIEEHLSEVQNVPDVQSYAEAFKSIFKNIIDDKVLNKF